MDDFYLFKSGTIRRKNGSVVLDCDDEEILIPVAQLRTLNVFGEVNVNKRILELFYHHGISILFFNYYGRLIGSFFPVSKSPVGDILSAQAIAVNDSGQCCHIASVIQIYSLNNCLSILKYYHKKGSMTADSIMVIEETLQETSQCNSVEEILLLEARAKKNYYKCFDQILSNTEFSFEKRSTRPPQNEFNAVISFGYHLLYGTVLAELHLSKLYPELAFIHSDQRSGYGLQYDLADIYKPVLVDRLFLGMIRRHQLLKTDFERREDGGVYLTVDGMKKCAAAYDNELQRKIKYGNRMRSYRSVIRYDIHQLTRHLLDPTYPLKFYSHSW